MFQADRVFSQRDPLTGKAEWFFQAREGNIGPYETRDIATVMLKQFIERCIRTGEDGGRNKKAHHCEFRAHSATDSMSIRPPVPRAFGH